MCYNCHRQLPPPIIPRASIPSLSVYFTDDPVIARDVGRIFTFITGYAGAHRTGSEWRRVAPVNLRQRLVTIPIAAEDLSCQGGPRGGDLDEDDIRWSIPVSSASSIENPLPVFPSISWCAAFAAYGRGCRGCPTISA